MANLTISKIIKGLPRLKTYDTELVSYEETHKFLPSYPVVDKATYLGIEIEVENVLQYAHSTPYWTMKEDGSLRNNGKEFITPPIRAHRVEQAVTTLLNSDLNMSVDFSERTSIHIHMNVRTLTPSQLYSLIMIYIMYEKAIFNFIGHSRDQNIFCNPLHTTTEANLFTNLETDLYNCSRRWNKYTALNLNPITMMGTIEFRHMHGTKDIHKIMSWINMLLSMKKYVLKTDNDYIAQRILRMNTSSEYQGFCNEVFGSLANNLTNYKDFVKDCSYCVTYAKEYYYTSELKLELLNTTKGRLGEYKKKYMPHIANFTIGTRGGGDIVERLQAAVNRLDILDGDFDEHDERFDDEGEDE